MAGLVSYASSDEEDEEHQLHQVEATVAVPAKSSQTEETPVAKPSIDATKGEQTTQISPPESIQPPPGPVLPPSLPIGPSLPTAQDESSCPNNTNALPSDQPSASPYSQTRSALHDLTLPSIANLSIPPSPPGSPPQSTTKKFSQFLDLKQKGTHFNSKLESSSALRNPGLMDKLLDFAEIDNDPKSQYETTLAADLWDPRAFPDWSFRTRLRRTQQKVAKELEAGKMAGTRTAVDFVPASSPGGEIVPAKGGGIKKVEKRKAGWN